MRAWAWFAAVCASLGAVPAAAADGLELSLRVRGAVARFEAAEAAAGLREAIPAPRRPSRAEADPSLFAPACEAAAAVCTEPLRGRLFYPGARRYMPQWEGLAADGISLRRYGVILRYSFR